MNFGTCCLQSRNVGLQVGQGCLPEFPKQGRLSLTPVVRMGEELHASALSHAEGLKRPQVKEGFKEALHALKASLTSVLTVLVLSCFGI